jgi:hypothetical protein
LCLVIAICFGVHCCVVVWVEFTEFVTVLILQETEIVNLHGRIQELERIAEEERAAMNKAYKDLEVETASKIALLREESELKVS